MNLQDYVTNDPELRKILIANGNPQDDTLQILGSKWHTIHDNLLMQLSSPTLYTPNTDVTKRSVLKFTASLFDPLGLLVPCIVTLKLFLQYLWKKPLTWDTSLPKPLQEEFNTLIQDWHTTPPFTFSRYTDFDSNLPINLHCFFDASQKAYGAVCYLTGIDTLTRSPISHLLISKNKIVPLQPTTLTTPRLELMAILIGTRLITFCHTQLNMPITKFYLWSDSTCALAWLTNPQKETPSIFVRNRFT